MNIDSPTANAEHAKESLKSAWDDLIAEMQAARDAIDNPALFPPLPDDRTLAEGYRYLAGFLHHGIERAFHEDPDFPAFRNALSAYNKSTIDNSDAIYFYAPIDGSKRYRISGVVEDFRHWRGEPRLKNQAVAPQYLIFDTANGPMAGDTGELSELRPGFRTGFGTLDTSNLVIDDNGEFELLLGPDKPAGYDGNFICTRKPPSKRTPDEGDRYATYISGRQLFYDWEYEQPIHLEITALDHEGDQPAALTAESTAARLRHFGGIVRGQMHFWLNFYDKVLNCFGTHGGPEDGGYFMSVNGYNRVNAASGATGGGMSTNLYAGGIFELEEDEALYIEAHFSGEPVYTSMHLGNLWGESPDYANHQSSLNHFQMYMESDKVQRWVVAHRDPGVQNWIDTTGLRKGYLSHRWAYSTLPAKEDWPTIDVKKIHFDEI
ncbi:MAG: hypothetical protein ACR2PS_17165, partial [Pseudomonadales bacterium]